MSRNTLRTGGSIPSEVSFVAPLASNGVTERIVPSIRDDRKRHG